MVLAHLDFFAEGPCLAWWLVRKSLFWILSVASSAQGSIMLPAKGPEDFDPGPDCAMLHGRELLEPATRAGAGKGRFPGSRSPRQF